jgi:Phosphotransferase enzyme family
MAQAGAEPFELAVRLTASAGMQAQALTQLAGGRNNRVFCVETAGEPLVLKCYHRDARDTRDRLGAEWRFLDYVWSRGVRVVPRPLAKDDAAGAALYAYAAGRKLLPSEVDARAVQLAADFIVAANAPVRGVSALEPASEACFSLADHLETIRRRVARLSELDPDAPLRQDAEAFLRDRLVPAWTRVEAAISAAAGEDENALAGRLPEAETIASPSDFGFHNALAASSGALTFIDFEYAGRDDPAKLACDFFCCPEIPVPLQHRPLFLQALKAGIGLPETFMRRADLLLDAYRIKWACIVLNDFLPVDASRRAFALADGRAERCRTQLGKADAKLAEIGCY